MGLGIIERLRRKGRPEDDLGGTPVNPNEKPIRVIDETKLNIPKQDDPDEENFGEHPGLNVPGTIVTKPSLIEQVRKTAKENKKEIAITTIFIAAGAAALIFIGKKNQIDKLPFFKENRNS